MPVVDLENAANTEHGNADSDSAKAEVKEHIWDSGDRIGYAAHIFWMIKEIGWVLLIPELCLPAGAFAAVTMIYSVITHCCQRPFEDVLCELVMCIWLCSNVLWMTSEVLFDDPDAKFPWGLCPVLSGEHQSVYETLELVVSDGFLISAGVYVLGVAWIAFRQCHLRGALGRVLLQCYLCSWCLKDYFWASENVWPAMCTDLVTVPMLLYHIHLQTGVRTASRAGCAWLAWTLANGIWILGELEFPGQIGFNFAACFMLVLALGLLISGYASYKEAEQQILCESSGDESSVASDDSQFSQPVDVIPRDHPGLIKL